MLKIIKTINFVKLSLRVLKKIIKFAPTLQLTPSHSHSQEWQMAGDGWEKES